MIESKFRKDMSADEKEKAERTFLAYYKLNGNATKSAEKAGFLHPKETGFRLKERLANNETATYVDINNMTLAEQQQWIKQFFANVIANGKLLMKDRISCARTLAQILNMFETKIAVEQEYEPLSHLSFEELLKLANT